MNPLLSRKDIAQVRRGMSELVLSDGTEAGAEMRSPTFPGLNPGPPSPGPLAPGPHREINDPRCPESRPVLWEGLS